MQKDVHPAITPHTQKHRKKAPLADEQTFNPTRGEQAMWRAVITQALMDAASNSKKPEALYFKGEALHWLLEGGQDFSTVCYYAGLEPDYVRRMAKQALMRGFRWRCEPDATNRARRRRSERTQPSPTTIPSIDAVFMCPSEILSFPVGYKHLENAA